VPTGCVLNSFCGQADLIMEGSLMDPFMMFTPIPVEKATKCKDDELNIVLSKGKGKKRKFMDDGEYDEPVAVVGSGGDGGMDGKNKKTKNKVEADAAKKVDAAKKDDKANKKVGKKLKVVDTPIIVLKPVSIKGKKQLIFKVRFNGHKRIVWVEPDFKPGGIRRLTKDELKETPFKGKGLIDGHLTDSKNLNWIWTNQSDGWEHETAKNGVVFRIQYKKVIFEVTYYAGYIVSRDSINVDGKWFDLGNLV
jgi:hypothetical protein